MNLTGNTRPGAERALTGGSSRESQDDQPEDVRCPRCRRVLLRVHRDETVLLGRVTEFRGEKATTACPNCKTRVEVPLRLTL